MMTVSLLSRFILYSHPLELRAATQVGTLETSPSQQATKSINHLFTYKYKELIPYFTLNDS